MRNLEKMSLRAKLMAVFAIIILMVGLTMGAYQARLLHDFFRRSATDRLLQQAQSMEILVGRLSIIPPADTVATRNLISIVSSITSTRVLVTDTSGRVVLDTADGELLSHTVSPAYISRALKDGLIDAFDFPIGGSDAVGAAIPWRYNGHITGCMILILPLDTVTRHSTSEAGKFMLQAGIFSGALALIFSYFLASNITGPLTRMAQVARSISKGDFLQRVDVKSKDELGDLAQAMNSMSEEISTLIDNVTREKDKLGKLVEERQKMISDISHDLRTPVTSIRGFVEALQDGVIKDQEEKKRVLTIIHDESERLSRLVDDLFYLVRLEAEEIPVETTDVDFAEVVQGSINAVGPLALEKHLDLRLVMDDAATSGKAMVKGSADRLTRAVVNLLDNAIKFSPEHGVVQVSLRVDFSNASSPQTILRVSDQGPGIPQEDIPHVFERFYRADKSRARHKVSAGLGLSIAKFVAEQHRGRIWIESESGKGSTFSLALPLRV